jgi:glycerol uptake facilitator-like aquaporin
VGPDDAELALDPETGTGALGLDLARRLTAEAFGAAMLIVAVIGSGIAASRLSTGDIGLQLLENVATVTLLLVIQGCVRSGRANAVPSAVGAWIGGAYWFTSSTSFANPAVTIARTLSDTFAGIAPASAPMFILMQLIGMVIAFGLVRLFYPHER